MLCFSPACRWFTVWGRRRRRRHETTEKRRFSSSLQSRRSTYFVIGCCVVFLDAATLRREGNTRCVASAKTPSVPSPLPFCGPPIVAENNSRPESQEPVGERRPRSSQSRLRRYTHSSLSLNEKGAEHNNQCLGGGGGEEEKYPD